MQRRFRQVDVFTTEPFRGNPVAVVLDGDGLSTEQMQAIASWTNLSETAFVCTPQHPEADYRLRIFCPAHEMRFAGHPTIGSAHALLEAGLQPRSAGVLVQECGVGLVCLKLVQGQIRVALPAATFRPVDAAMRAAVEQATGAALLQPPVVVDLGVAWLTGEVADAALLRTLRPDWTALGTAAHLAGANGITLFAREGDGLEVRSFAPHEGTPEDPVCGSGNGAVAYLLRERGEVRDYVARQGRCLGRDGRVQVSHDNDAIWIGGHAVTCIEGSIRT